MLALLQIDGLQNLGTLPNEFSDRRSFKVTSANLMLVHMSYHALLDSKVPILTLAPPNEILKKMIEGLENFYADAEQIVDALPQDESIESFSIDIDRIVRDAGDEAVARGTERSTLRFVSLLQCTLASSRHLTRHPFVARGESIWLFVSQSNTSAFRAFGRSRAMSHLFKFPKRFSLCAPLHQYLG